MNVHDSEFRERKLAFIDEKQAKELNGVTLQENDVLLNITGASVARCCIFPTEYLPARVNQHVSIIRPKKDMIDARFLNLLLT
jgi:type I restriction enzyme S subunit